MSDLDSGNKLFGIFLAVVWFLYVSYGVGYFAIKDTKIRERENDLKEKDMHD